MRRQRLLAAAALLAFLFCLFPATAFAAEDETKTANYDGYIMKLRDGASLVPSAAGPEPVEYCDGVYLIDDPAEALPYLKCGAVEYVEPNYTLELLDDTPNDPKYGDQWTLNAINYQSLYASGKDGSGVTVAVIDSGLYAWTEDGTYHGQEDFQSAVISPASRNFLGQESASALYYRDQKGHGTFVASQIAAATGNGVGISGIADGVTLMILRCIAGNTSATYPTDATMDSNSGSAAIVASAIYYATDHGADVINLSLGTTSSNAGVTLADSIAYAADKGVIIVAAAGNFGSTATCYPAGNSNVIGVASVDSSLERSSFSQYNDSVDVAAPGGMVCGANLYADGTGAVTTASYTTDSGTSYAAPVVSALAAIAKQYNKALDGDDFMSLLAVTSTDKGEKGKDNYYGYGVVDAQKLLAALQAPYSIEYVLNDTTEAPASLPANAPSTYALSRTDTITLPVPVRDGYAFTGWYELATLAGEPVTTLPAGALAFAAYDGAGVYSIPALKYYAGWKSYDAAKLSALSVKGRLAQEGASADTYSVTLPKGSAASLADLTAADFSIQCADSTAVVSGLASADGGRTWTFQVRAGQAIQKTYTVTVTLSDLAVPAVKVGAQSGTALLPSMDGLTAAGPYTADVSAWFADASRYVVLANTGSGTAQITDSTLSYTPGSSDFEGQQVTLTVGAANADFASDNTVAVTVTIGRAASNATAVLSTAQLDVFKDSALSAVLTMYANTLKSISLGARVLAEGTDYTVSGAELDTTRTVTFSKDFVQGLTPGTVNITFGFSGGHDAVAALTVTDSAPRYDVKFFLEHTDTEAYDTVNVRTGGTVGMLPTQPAKTGALFTGWYLADGTTRITANTTVTEALMVYASWRADGTGGNTGGSTGGNTGGSTGGNTGGSTGGSTGGNTGGNTGGSTAPALSGILVSGTNVAASIDGTRAVLTLSDDEIAALTAGAEPVTIDLSGVADADTVLIPAALTKTARLEVKTAAGTLTLTDLTPDGGDLEVSIRRGQDDQGRTVFSLSLLRGGRPVTALAGSATAVLPYALRAGEHAEDIVVAFRTEKQNYERADSTYDAQIGAAVVQLRHLSDYVVASFPFDDVAAGSWYDDSMLNAYLNGLIEGVGQRRLAPEAAMNRAMLVTILWRLAGSPTAAGMSRFADVPADAWYAAAVAWASENGIVKGYSSTRFGPLDELNREQMMVILYRYEQYRGGGFSGAWAFPLGYADAADVSGWAYEAACWCTMNSIVNGVGENTLVPAGKADRAQLAAVLSRYMAR